MSEPIISFQPLAYPQTCPVYVEATPPSEKPALVLLHGFMMSRAIWRENLAELSKHFRCVIIELLGHGRSGAPDVPAAYKMSSYLEALNDIREQLGTNTLSFCAHSFGAGIALSYGLAYPEFTDKIVFTNSRSALGSLQSKPGDIDRLKSALRSNGAETLAALPAHPRNMKKIKPNVREALMEDAKLLDPIGISHSMEITANAANLMARLSELTPPTLLINGKNERGFQPARTEVAEKHPNVTIRDIDAGHSVNAERPMEFNELAISFLI